MEIHQPGQIIALARARRARELGRLPGWGTPQVWQRLRARDSELSSGTLVAILRCAVRQHQVTVAKELFIQLLGRIEVGNTFWARHAMRRIARVPSETAQMMGDDLLQELTLHLWEELALRESEGWELFFRRSLAFARTHVAARYLERQGYRSGRRMVLFFSDMAARPLQGERDGDACADALPLVEPRDPFAAADLADLRHYVERLPSRERAAVVMRYWQHAREHEIAEALGVTSRTVRNLLQRAAVRLYALYTRQDTSPTAASARLDRPDEGGTACD